jgi:adenylosuccinate synthase
MASNAQPKTVVVIGGQDGDEGKGNVIMGLFNEGGYEYDARYQGGDNAGHRSKRKGKTFSFHILPCGLLVPGTIGVITGAVALKISAVEKELQGLAEAGFDRPELKISDRVQISLPWHQLLDEIDEERRSKTGRQFGSTKSGIAPFYSDAARKVGVQVGQLWSADLANRLEETLARVNSELVHFYGREPLKLAAVMEQLKRERDIIAPYVTNTTELLHTAKENGKGIIFEGQLGAGRDMWNGQYPMVTSSPTTAFFAAAVTGIIPDRVYMVVKAYHSMVGVGVFPTRFEDRAFEERFRFLGGDKGEFGEKTGRPRELGWLNLPALKHAVRLNGGPGIVHVALTNVDVWGESGLDELKVCVAYELDGKVTTEYPGPADFARVKPVYETLKAWKMPKDEIRKCRIFGDLPAEARAYVAFIESYLGTRVSRVCIGPDAEDQLER